MGGPSGYPAGGFGGGYPGYGGAVGLGTVGGYGQGCSGPFYGPYGIGGTRAHKVVVETNECVRFYIKLLPKCECACDKGSKVHRKHKKDHSSSCSDSDDHPVQAVGGNHGMYRPVEPCTKGLKCGDVLKCKDKRCLSSGYGWVYLTVCYHRYSKTATLRWNIELRETFPVIHIDFHGPARYYGCEAPVVFRANQQGNLPRRLSCQVVGEQEISCYQANQILGGQWYINVATTRFPCGELRGYIY